MNKKFVVSNLVIASLLIPASLSVAADSPNGPMAKLCANCHDPQPGVMMGFLDNISVKAKTIQMNFLSHKDVVKFNDETTIKYVSSIKDIRNYLGKGFTIHFDQKNGDKIATAITRFDILKTIDSGEYKVDKLSKDQFTAMLEGKKASLYDVRPPMLYKQSHIPGAKPLPAPAFDKFKSKLPADKSTPIVLYGVGGCLSPTVAFNTKSLGYENVSIYTAGYPEWTKSEYTVTTPDWLVKAIQEDIPHVLIDLRNPDSVNKNHIKGAVSIAFDQLAANKDKFPKKKNAPIILYGNNKEKAAKMIVSWGYRAVRILPVPFDKWLADGKPVASGSASTEIVYVPKPKPGTVSIEDFKKAATAPSAKTMIIDVRNPDEANEGMVPNAINIPVDQMSNRMAEIPGDKTILLYCPSGVRAEMARNILEQAGKNSRYLDAIIKVEDDGSFEIEEK